MKLGAFDCRYLLPGPGPFFFSLALTHTNLSGEETETSTNMMSPSPDSTHVPPRLSTPYHGCLGIPGKLTSTSIMHTGPCKIIIAGTPRPCPSSEFNLQHGLLAETLCPICMPLFHNHDIPACRAAIVEAPSGSVSPKPVPEQLAGPAKRARLHNDFQGSSVAGGCYSGNSLLQFLVPVGFRGAQQPVFLKPTYLGFDVYQTGSEDRGAAVSAA